MGIPRPQAPTRTLCLLFLVLSTPNFPLDVPRNLGLPVGTDSGLGGPLWHPRAILHPSAMENGIFVPLMGDSLCLVHRFISPSLAFEPRPAGNVIPIVPRSEGTIVTRDIVRWQ